MRSLAVVVFAYGGDRPIYLPWHAKNMQRMVSKHLTVPHRFIVVTDNEAAHRAEGLETVPLWTNPHHGYRKEGWVNCYARLGLFSDTIGGFIANRILSIDLDAVIRAPIDDLIQGDEPFKILGLRSRAWLQGGMFRVDPGCVWPNPWHELLRDEETKIFERGHKWVGSDQGILSELFYAKALRGEIPRWTEDDGMAINDFHASWRVFFRTGPKKCWQEGMPERAEYLAQSGNPIVPGDLPFSRGSERLSGKTIQRLGDVTSWHK
jgi:hypothetical protein